MSTLVELAEKHRPSKMWHGYMPAFDLLVGPIRDKVKRVLEIGVDGGESLRMWAEYFPDAEIVGLDINDKCRKHGGGNIIVAIGDQGDRRTLASLGEFDLIVDDGSHLPEHQIGTFMQMFPENLRNGGIYVIEDMETPRLQPTRNMLKNLIDILHWWPDGLKGKDWPKLNHFPENAPPLSKIILSMHVYRYLAFITKGRSPEEGEAARRLAE